jgi:hypothetical protein
MVEGKRKGKKGKGVKVTEAEKEVLKRRLKSMEEKERREREEEKEREVRREWRKSEMEKVKEGKRPFYLKKGEFAISSSYCSRMHTWNGLHHLVQDIAHATMVFYARMLFHTSFFELLEPVLTNTSNAAAERELLLTSKYSSMTPAQRDHALDRRHKKLAHRERKAMPAARRG